MGAAEQYSKLQRDQKDQRDKDAQAKAGPSKKGPGVFAVPRKRSSRRDPRDGSAQEGS